MDEMVKIIKAISRPDVVVRLSSDEWGLKISVSKRFMKLRKVYTFEELSAINVSFADFLDCTVTSLIEKLDEALGEDH